MPGVEGSEMEGEPMEEVMTEYGEARPLTGEARGPMPEGWGREELMTDGWPIMVLIGGG